MRRFPHLLSPVLLFVFLLKFFSFQNAWAVTISSVNPSPARVGEAVTIRGTFSGQAESARVNFGDGTQSSCITSTPFSTTHAYRRPGTYTITITEYASSDCTVPIASVATSITIYDLIINWVELKFTDGRGETTVERNKELKLLATIRYSGAGVLRGRWEVDNVPISIFNQTLITGKNGGSITLESPLLPTFDVGSHEAKLVITYPTPSFTLPTLRYFVFPEGSKPPPKPSSMGPLIASASNTVPSPTWETSKGAKGTLIYENDIKKSPKTLRPYDPREKELLGQLDLTFEGKKGGDTFKFEASPRYYNKDDKGEGRDHLWNLPKLYFLFSHDGEKLDTSFELGDLSIDESPYTASGLIRRGLGAGVALFDRLKVRGYSVRTTETVAISDGLGIGERDFRLDGGSLSVDLLKEGLLTIKTVYLNGRLGDQTFFTTATGEPPVKGETLGFILGSSLPEKGLKGEMEFTRSDFDSNTTDTVASKKDEAKRIGLSFTHGGLNLGGNVFRIGRDFRSIGSLGSPWDQEGYTLTGGYTKGPASLNLSFTDSKDNVEKEPDRSRIETRTGTAGLSYSIIEWATLGLNYSRALQDSTYNPSGTIPVENTTDTYGASLGLSSKGNSITIGGSLSHFNDESELNLDNRRGEVRIEGLYQREGFFSLRPRLEFTRSKDLSTLVRTDGRLAALESSIIIIQETLTLDLRGTAAFNKATDNSVKDRTYNLFTRLALNIGRLVPWIGRQVLSLKFDYKGIDDDVNPANDRVEKLIFLAFEGSLSI